MAESCIPSISRSAHHKVQAKPVFLFFFFSFLKLRFSAFLSKSAKLVVFLLAWDLILSLGEVVICLFIGKHKKNLASCFTTGLGFRLQTVKTSLQKRISKNERNPGVEELFGVLTLSLFT